MRKSFGRFFCVAGGLLALDQVLKYLVDSSLRPGESVVLIPGFASISYVRNTGAAFGILAEMRGPWASLFFVAVTALVLFIVLLVYRGLSPSRSLPLLALPVVFGGGAGNLIDRLRYGEVIDFMDLYVNGYHWPAFNLADASISVGVGLLLLDMLRGRPPKQAGGGLEGEGNRTKALPS